MVIEKFNHKTNKKLLEYIFKKCNYFTLTYQESSTKEYYDILKKILFEDLNYKNEDMLFLDSEKSVEKIVSDLYEIKENLDLKEFLNITKKWFHFPSEFSSDEQLKQYLKNEVLSLIFLIKREEKHRTFIEKYKDCLVSKTIYYYTDEQRNGYEYSLPDIQTICYKFLLNPKTQDFLLKQNNICDDLKDIPLIDLSFYKDESCFLRIRTLSKADSDENFCYIICESEDEYEYLKSIGVEFYDKQYVNEKIDERSFNGKYYDPYIDYF